MFEVLEMINYWLLIAVVLGLAFIVYIVRLTFLSWVRGEYFKLKKYIVKQILISERVAIRNNEGSITSEFLKSFKESDYYTYLRDKLTEVTLLHDRVKVRNVIDLVKYIRETHTEIKRVSIATRSLKEWTNEEKIINKKYKRRGV